MSLVESSCLLVIVTLTCRREKRLSMLAAARGKWCRFSARPPCVCLSAPTSSPLSVIVLFDDGSLGVDEIMLKILLGSLPVSGTYAVLLASRAGAR